MNSVIRRATLVLWLSGLLIACESGSELGSSELPDTPPDAVDTFTVSGYVGNASLSDAQVMLVDADVTDVTSVTSDSSAAYAVEVANNTAMPLKLLATAGEDSINGQPAEFEMMAMIRDNENPTHHISPLSTLAAHISDCDEANNQAASTLWSRARENHSLGLSPSRDPLHEPISVSNAAQFALANEALREIVRRSQQGLSNSGAQVTPFDIVRQMGCDLAVDGRLTGLGANVDARLIATVHAAQVGVLLELIAGQLYVDGEPANARLDAAIARATGSFDISVIDVQPTPALIAEASRTVALFVEAFSDSELTDMAAALNGEPQAVKQAVASALDSAHQITLWGLPERMALADTSLVDEVITRANEQSTASPPIISLAASATSADAGSSVQLSWATSAAESCTARGDWSGTQNLEGIFDTGALVQTSNFILECAGLGGSTTANVAVVVIEPQASPTTTLSVDSQTLQAGGSTTLRWTSANAAQCEALGDWSGAKPVIGNQSTGPLLTSSTYTLTCSGDTDSASSSVTVDVNPAPTPIPVVGLNVDRTTVGNGETVTLSWSSSDASNCSANGGWSGNQNLNGSAVVGPISTQTSFALNCTGAGGNDASSVLVNVLPELSFSANATSITSGEPVAVTWDGSNVDSCTASGAWSGTKTTSGSESLTLSATGNLALSCSGPAGVTSDSITITVSDPQSPPTVTLQVAEPSIAQGSTTVITWSSTNADSCSASNGWSGNKTTNGSETTSALTQDTTFTITCTSGAGSDTANVSVQVAPGIEPTVTLTAAESLINSGDVTSLSWSSTDATSCSASGDWSGSKSTSGSENVGPLTQTSTYTLSCTGNGGTAVNIISIDVTGNLTLSWAAPTENVDGSQLTDLARYEIYYGGSTGDYDGQTTITDPNDTSITLVLPTGTYYMVMTAVDAGGNESAYSNEVVKTSN